MQGSSSKASRLKTARFSSATTIAESKNSARSAISFRQSRWWSVSAASALTHMLSHTAFALKIWTMDTLERLSGNRVNYAMNTIGGARRDIDDDTRKYILAAIDDLEEKMKPIVYWVTNDKTLAMRTKGVGILTTEDAVKLGAVGPHARASGVDIDVRRDAPYSSYDDFEFNVPVEHSCDVYARVVVRVLEVLESIKIIRQALENLPEGPINLGTKIPKVPAGRCTMRHEAPRGQLVYQVVTDGGPTNYRVSVHVPTYRNAPTIPYMMKGNTVADAGLIVASIDPCFSCLDR